MKKTTGYILNGVYYTAGEPPKYLKDDHAITDKHYSHDRQRENHRRDLIQPYTAKGKPNPEFIQEYPEMAKQYGFIK